MIGANFDFYPSGVIFGIVLVFIIQWVSWYLPGRRSITLWISDSILTVIVEYSLLLIFLIVGVYSGISLFILPPDEKSINDVLYYLGTLILICLTIGTYASVLAQYFQNVKKDKKAHEEVAAILAKQSAILLYASVYFVSSFILLLTTRLNPFTSINIFDIFLITFKGVIMPLSLLLYILGIFPLSFGIARLFGILHRIVRV